MYNNLINVLIVLLGWLVYSILHSTLASTTVKAWFARRYPGLAHHYRLAYNLIAALALMPLIWLIHTYQGAPIWSLTGPGRWLVDGMALAAMAGFFWSLRFYDMREFLGLRPVASPGQERRFTLSPLHRHVRHPWYSFGLVVIWSRDMDTAWLASCIAISLYFALGSRLEERKLAAEFGEAYRRYQERVPALIPLPGRSLNRDEAEEIIESVNSYTSNSPGNF